MGFCPISSKPLDSVLRPAGDSLRDVMCKEWQRLCLTVYFLVASGCTGHAVRVPAEVASSVVVSDAARESLPNDYLRVSFLPPDTIVTTLSRPGALRAFVTATPLFLPPLKVAELPYYSGLVNDDAKVLVAMRCKPPKAGIVDAMLATWPNVFSAIRRDVPLDSGTCATESTDARIQAACFARNFSDPPQATVAATLAHTFSYAGTIYDGRHSALEKWLQDNYGISPAFSGTGYSVKDSYSLNTQPMDSQQILAKSVSSEYILKNVPLSEAGCNCISVPPYRGRSNDRLDPNFIDRAGGHGTCASVDHLQFAK